MWTATGRAITIFVLMFAGLSVAQNAPGKPGAANFSITATDTNVLTGEEYSVTGTFSTAGALRPGVAITSWNISAGPHDFSNLESPWSNANVFLAVPNSTTIKSDTYPNLGKSNCASSANNLRIQFFNYLTGYFFTAYVPTGELVGPGTQADLTVSGNCLFVGGISYYSTRRSGLASLNTDPGWDHSNFLDVQTCMLYENGTEACGFGNDGAAGIPGNYTEGTVMQF